MVVSPYKIWLWELGICRISVRLLEVEMKGLKRGVHRCVAGLFGIKPLSRDGSIKHWKHLERKRLTWRKMVELKYT